MTDARIWWCYRHDEAVAVFYGTECTGDHTEDFAACRERYPQMGTCNHGNGVFVCLTCDREEFEEVLDVVPRRDDSRGTESVWDGENFVTAHDDDTAKPETYIDRYRAALVDSSGLDSISEPEPVIKDIIYVDSLVWLQGKPGNGKSFVALDIAGCVGTGESWQGYGVAKQGTVLYLAAEGVSGIKQRVRAWEAAMGHEMHNVKFLPIAVQAAHDGEWSGFVALARELRPVLVIVDTQARISVGMEENSAKDMGGLVHRLEMVRQATGACILIVHHKGRTGDHMRGSTAMEGAATTVISTDKDGEMITVSCLKQKDAIEFDEFKLRLISYGPSAILSLTATVDGDLSRNPDATKFLKAWWNNHETDQVSATTLIDSGLVTKPTFYRYAKSLEKQGLIGVETIGRNKLYRLRCEPS